jgi:hypothetical protein
VRRDWTNKVIYRPSRADTAELEQQDRPIPTVLIRVKE